MKVLLVGLGTVGEAIARLSAGRPWLEQMVLADHDLDRVRQIAGEIGDRASHPIAHIACHRAQGRHAACAELATTFDVVLDDA